MKKATVKKIGNILLNVLMYVFLALCIFAVILTVLSKKTSDGASEIFGYQFRVVVSDSMAKCELTDVSEYDIKSIPVRSMVFVQTIPDDPAEAEEWYRSLKVGDVLTFRYIYATQVTITHRIIAISEKATGGFEIVLAGDNKNSDREEAQLTQVIDTTVGTNINYVIGKVTGQSYLLGLIMSILMQPVGIVCAIIVPCLIIMMLEILKIVRIFSEDKKQKDAEISAQKDSELEELRRRLSELEQIRGDAPAKDVNNETTDIQQPTTNEEESQK